MVISENNRVYNGECFTGGLGAKMTHPDGRPYHTFRTASVLVDGNKIVFNGCVFENTAGPGERAGQAIALYLDGDDIVLNDCVLKGWQDTLFLAPLPPKEYEKDGFIGPKQFTPRVPRTFTFNRCRIEGDVDFVFGGATAFFNDCEFVSLRKGYVFAPSTPEGAEAGFVIKNCRFLRAAGVEDGSCYIARPWREYAKLSIENCYMDAHIAPEGYVDWGKPHEGLRFTETGSYGPGAGKRADWVMT
ncbi:MAG: pectin esterase [Lachnospiraceae bacterium]|nr:pectin esterase [Lachnospiraceae bacterium]